MRQSHQCLDIWWNPDSRNESPRNVEFSQVMFRGGEYDLLFIIRDYLIDGDDLVRGKHQPFFDDNVSDLRLLGSIMTRLRVPSLSPCEE